MIATLGKNLVFFFIILFLFKLIPGKSWGDRGAEKWCWGEGGGDNESMLNFKSKGCSKGHFLSPQNQYFELMVPLI